MEIILKLLFLAFSNINILFDTKSLIYKSYSIAEVLLIARQVKMIDKYKFAKVALDKYCKMFIMHIVPLKALELTILV